MLNRLVQPDLGTETTEQKRSCFLQIWQDLKDPDTCDVLVVGGPPGAGKTETVNRIALKLAQEGILTKIIDIDYLLEQSQYGRDEYHRIKWQELFARYLEELTLDKRARAILISGTFVVPQSRTDVEELALTYNARFHGMFNVINLEDSIAAQMSRAGHPDTKETIVERATAFFRNHGDQLTTELFGPSWLHLSGISQLEEVVGSTLGPYIVSEP